MHPQYWTLNHSVVSISYTIDSVVEQGEYLCASVFLYLFTIFNGLHYGLLSWTCRMKRPSS